MSDRKINPRVWMGICSGVGYLVILGIKAWQFGWEDVPEYWLWAGAGLALVMVAVGLVHHRRDRRAFRAEMERIHARAHVRRREEVASHDPSEPSR